MITILILLSLSLSDPNTLANDFGWQMIMRYWLSYTTIETKWQTGGMKDFTFESSTVGPYRSRVVASVKDPNQMMITWHKDKLFNYDEFARFARSYPDDPNHVKPPEPNWPGIIADVNDPAFEAAVKEMMSR